MSDECAVPRVNSLMHYPFAQLNELLADISPPQGIEKLILSIGEPKKAPALIKEKLLENLDGWSSYPSLEGIPNFNEAVKNWCVRRFQINSSLLDKPRSILPASGTREALFQLAQAVVPERNTKDGKRSLVVVPNPFYPGYIGSAIMSGAEPLFLNGAGKRGSLPDLASLPEETLDRIALAYICTPSNPVGDTASMDYLIQTIQIARKHDIVVAFDECVIDLYLNEPVPSALQACEELGHKLDNVVVFQSLSKRSSAAGLRSGAVIGDPEIMNKFWQVRCFGGATIPVPIQEVSACLWNDDEHVVEIRADINKRFDVAESYLKDKYEFYRPDAGFFLFINVGDGKAAAKRLWQEAGIKVMPGSFISQPVNGDNPYDGYIRIALVHEPSVVEEMMRRLVEVL